MHCSSLHKASNSSAWSALMPLALLDLGMAALLKPRAPDQSAHSDKSNTDI